MVIIEMAQKATGFAFSLAVLSFPFLINQSHMHGNATPLQTGSLTTAGKTVRHSSRLVHSSTAQAKPASQAVVLFNQGNQLLDAQQYPEALSAFTKATQIQPNYVNAWHQRGITLNYLQRYQEALAAFDQALRLEPDNYLSLSARSVSLNYLKRYQEALASINKALQLQPNFPSTWFYQGWTLSNLQRYKEALAALDQALRLNPDFQLARDMREQIQQQLGR